MFSNAAGFGGVFGFSLMNFNSPRDAQKSAPALISAVTVRSAGAGEPCGLSARFYRRSVVLGAAVQDAAPPA